MNTINYFPNDEVCHHSPHCKCMCEPMLRLENGEMTIVHRPLDNTWEINKMLLDTGVTMEVIKWAVLKIESLI